MLCCTLIAHLVLCSIRPQLEASAAALACAGMLQASPFGKLVQQSTLACCEAGREDQLQVHATVNTA